MTSRVLSVLLVCGVAACAPSAPFTRPGPEAEVPPVRALLSERERLSLSPEQVVALDSISREMDVTQREVSRRFGIIKARLVPRLGSASHKPRDRMAAAESPAVEAVEKLLNPDQRQRLCAVQLARQSKVAVRGDKRALTGGGHSFAGSGARRGDARTWPWCSSTASHAAATAQSDS